MVPCHHTCHHVFLYAILLAHSIPIQVKKLLCKVEIKHFSYWPFSVQASLVWNNLPAHIQHCSSLSQFRTSLKTFLFISAYSNLNYSNPFRGIGCCTWSDLDFAADFVTGWLMGFLLLLLWFVCVCCLFFVCFICGVFLFCFFGGGGMRLGERGGSKGLRDCVYLCVGCVCAYACMCGCRGGGIEWDM